jgi:hypothetical protein
VIGVARTAVAAPAEGQRKLESKDVAVSQRCSAIAEKVRKGVTPENALLISELRACDESAGAVLGPLWAVRNHDVDVLRHLIHASSEVRDARIVDAVSAAVNDTSRANVQRAAALTVLASYIDPSFIGEVDANGGRINVQVVARTHAPPPMEGSHPVGDSLRTAMLSLTRRVQEGERGDLKCIADFILQVQKVPARC